MRLIGMLDSPYVRRVAVALHLMDMPFAHEAVSVFRQFDAFAAVNPVVKAPTLVADDGTVLMDSTLILLFAERLVAPARRLAPPDAVAHLLSLRASGLALAACEKTVQLVYELNLRPAEKRHRPWLDRVGAQLGEAYRLLDGAMPVQGWTGPGRRRAMSTPPWPSAPNRCRRSGPPRRREDRAWWGRRRALCSGPRAGRAT